MLGTGAIGGLIGGALADQGHDLTFVDRGERLDVLRAHGLKITGLHNESRIITCAKFVDVDSIDGKFDFVFLAVKAHQIPTMSGCLRRILGNDTPLLTLQNGIPWWYFQGVGGHLDGASLKTLDPDGSIAEAVRTQSIVGAVVYPAAEVDDDGVIHHIEGDRIVIGELDGDRSARLQHLADMLSEAGFRGQIQTDIRAEVWLKSWGSLAFNPLSALTRATMAELCRSADTRALVTQLMQETMEVAASLGVTMRVPLERRIAGAEQVGEHKTSMLQDLEAGRQMEIDAVIGSVLEIADITGISTPQTRTVYALVKKLNDNTRSKS